MISRLVNRLKMQTTYFGNRVIIFLHLFSFLCNSKLNMVGFWTVEQAMGRRHLTLKEIVFTILIFLQTKTLIEKITGTLVDKENH